MSKVVELNELNWRLDSGGPYLKPDSGLDINVDPCPAYAHDTLLVESEFARLQEIAPLHYTPDVYILAYECLSRCNGWAEEYSNQLVLSAKRTPIHPAMTRYLMSHEYGHFVEYRLKDIRNDRDLLKKYREIRGGDLTFKPGRWHLSTQELFANDFRVLVSGREVDFWPHPDFPHPTKLDKIQDFWADAVEELQIESVKR